MFATLVPAQQRRALRRGVRVDCQVVRERDFALVGRCGLDLSPFGMLVLAEKPVITGEALLVAFRLPRSTWWFDAEATVARVVHGRRPGDHGRCVGLEFDGLDGALQYFLHTTLQGVPPPVPRRDARIDYAASVERALS
ncbi:MAG: PilZ domain-containing protein [Polyangiaceae bacterium]